MIIMYLIKIILMISMIILIYLNKLSFFQDVDPDRNNAIIQPNCSYLIESKWFRPEPLTNLFNLKFEINLKSHYPIYYQRQK